LIKSFADKTSEDIFHGRFSTKHSRKLPNTLHKRAFLLLHAMNATKDLNDLKIPPDNRLKELKGDRKGIWSLRINDQWRITFHVKKPGEFSDVRIEDYH